MRDSKHQRNTLHVAKLLESTVGTALFYSSRFHRFHKLTVGIALLNGSRFHRFHKLTVLAACLS